MFPSSLFYAEEHSWHQSPDEADIAQCNVCKVNYMRSFSWCKLYLVLHVHTCTYTCTYTMMDVHVHLPLGRTSCLEFSEVLVSVLTTMSCSMLLALQSGHYRFSFSYYNLPLGSWGGISVCRPQDWATTVTERARKTSNIAKKLTENLVQAFDSLTVQSNWSTFVQISSTTKLC